MSKHRISIEKRIINNLTEFFWGEENYKFTLSVYAVVFTALGLLLAWLGSL